LNELLGFVPIVREDAGKASGGRSDLCLDSGNSSQYSQICKCEHPKPIANSEGLIDEAGRPANPCMEYGMKPSVDKGVERLPGTALKLV
jgi:hypothetical protein